MKFFLSLLSFLLWAVVPKTECVTCSGFSFNENIEVVVHRGANKIAPENTRAAAQAAIDLGAEYVEVDVRTSKDGVLYILHDPMVNRTTNGSGFISRMTSVEIDKLDAGSWFAPEFAGEQVPRLREYLLWIKGKAKVYFDVKDADLRQLVELVLETGFENDCFFWFRSNKKALELKRIAPDLPLKVNASAPEAIKKIKQKFNARILECSLDALTPAFVEACRQHEIKIMVYGGKEDKEYFTRVLLHPAVDMINLDNPELYYQVKREMMERGK